MPKTMKVCRVCGKQYEACYTPKVNPNVFRYQDVACSPECGRIYLKRVYDARNGVAGAQTNSASTVTPPVGNNATYSNNNKKNKTKHTNYSTFVEKEKNDDTQNNDSVVSSDDEWSLS